MRKLVVLLLALMLVGTVGCGTNKMTKDKEPTKKEVVQIEETVEQEDSTLTNDTIEETTVNSEDSNENQDLDNKNESTSNKNETTTKPSTGSTTKPNTGSTGNTGLTNNSGNTGNKQNNSTSTTTQPSTPVHEHKWTEVKETVVVQEAWVEDVYAWRTLCGKCNLDMTEMTDEELMIHCSLRCNSCYSAEYIKIDEIQHPAVTEERVTGYKCECGAEKK